MSSGELSTTPGTQLAPRHAQSLGRVGYGSQPSFPPAQNANETEGNFAVDLLEYWRIFNKRRGLIASVVGAALLGAVLVTFLQQPLYTASARIQIDRDSPQILDKGDVMEGNSEGADFILTQIMLLQSRSVAERTLAALNIEAAPSDERGSDPGPPKAEGLAGSVKSFIYGLINRNAAPAEPATTNRASVASLQNHLTVAPIRGSRLVDVHFSDPSPDRAQRIVNSHVEAFISTTIDRRFEANAYAKTFLDEQISQLKQKLRSSEQSLLDFAQKEQIVEASDKTSIAESNLAAANATLGNLVADRIKNENLWRQVENVDGFSLPQILTNSVIDGLRAKRNVLETDFEEKLQTFKPDYPDMVQISNRMKEIDRQLKDEVEVIKRSLKGAYESALAQENEMKARINALKTEVIDLQKRSVQYNILKREVDSNRDIYNGLLQRYKEVDVAGGVRANNIFIIERAEKPLSPSSPKLSRALLIALSAGLVAGLVAAYVVEMIDDTVRAPSDLEQISGLPTLGVIPLIEAPAQAETELNDPRSGLCEAYRTLCTSLQFATEHGLPKTLLVSSSGPGEGKSLTSVAIARHFSTMGLRVLLIDADLRKASLHSKLQLSNSVGLSNYLTGACTPPDAFQQTDLPNLALMSSGPLPPNAADLLASPRMVSLLTVGLEVFDLIVVDGPPVMGLADAAILSNSVEGTVFVAAAGQARSSAIRDSLRRLQLARSPLIGTVLAKFSMKAAGYGYGYGYGHGYGYGYGYGYGHDPLRYGGADDGKPQQIEKKGAA